MTLEQVKAEWLKNPDKRIVRKPNSGFRCVSVWFTVEGDNLMVNEWLCTYATGMELLTKKAPFQASEHSDWVLID